MKHRDLIIAAMDGKTIQYRQNNSCSWIEIEAPAPAIKLLAGCPDAYQYRIKPEPVPDKVSFGMICNSVIYPESIVHRWMSQKHQSSPYCTHMVKLTIKTDENGVETKTVEIVK